MKKAQIFTLDAMLSLVLVVMALGLIIHSFELKEYTLREEELFNELKSKAEVASLMLSINEKIICEIQQTKMKMQNCIATNNNKLSRLKELLGLNADFGCRLANARNETIGNCSDNIPDNKNIVSIKKKLLVLNDNPTKSNWNTCINMGCPFEDYTLSIWRA